MKVLENRNFKFLSASTVDVKKYTFGSRDWIPVRQGFLWKIERGAVRTLTWNQQGTPVTLGLWGAGDVVGAPLTRVEPYKIESLTPVELNLVPFQPWEELFFSLISYVQQSEELIRIIRSDRVPMRLHQFLIWLAEKFGTPVEIGRRIDLRLTHQDIAEFIGTSRVTVTRLIKLFEREGVIVRARRHLILLDTIM
ncbi:MAG: Crp/Fnr family transcriptional regulator [Oscillatoriaceae bacterium SKW80]|nr:Crp/Fnr family transcriptional regulator [Oscillatoriaceae bacterium SKYG93]MCX8120613.1 Crp/Fnr family transcriptional regulator [Oscillatoriaceae bacterium SKW80]MDW8453848.1 Crp/Fnr family transcriptional regulator [Oscillatoriaceae cyanobacterium SKYGB_i_bin93]HIK27079.1 Crp/Fnr family transcriptional regulator [Oscillatoriaceae cyanobacterium M7585_C2015_266]